MHKLPVYVFTEHENAVRATISITVTGSRSYTVNGKKVVDPFSETFEAEATRDKEGFFRFDLTAGNSKPHDPFAQENDESYALFSLSHLCSDNAYFDGQRTMVIPITVTLYDADGNEILTRELQLGPWEAPKPEA